MTRPPPVTADDARARPMANHDPLCQQPYRQRATCRDCDVITRARADERERIAQEIEALRDHEDFHELPGSLRGVVGGWINAARRIARGGAQ